MEPIAITVRGDGEWVIVHRCRAAPSSTSIGRPATTTR
jgi:hypothetical protein